MTPRQHAAVEHPTRARRRHECDEALGELCRSPAYVSIPSSGDVPRARSGRVSTPTKVAWWVQRERRLVIALAVAVATLIAVREVRSAVEADRSSDGDGSSNDEPQIDEGEPGAQA